MSKLYTPTQLSELPPLTPSNWIVEGLLRTERGRPSILSGFPTAGKSTLAHQLAIAVANGTPFLGRATFQSDVIIWKIEDTPQDISEDLIKAGMTNSSRLRVLAVEENHGFKANKEDLEKAFVEYPDTRLVIIETIMDFLDIEDISKNGDCKRALTEFRNDFVMKHTDCVFLFLHHLNKSNDDAALSIKKIMGSTALSSGMDTMMYLEKESDENPKRKLMVDVRKGVPIPKTYLYFDEATSTMHLNGNVKDEAAKMRQAQEDKKELEFKLKICLEVKNTPGITKAALMKAVKGNSVYASDCIKQLVDRQELIEKFGGKKGNARMYYLPADAHLHDTNKGETK
jgi:RecA-family ATPase